MQRLEPLGVPVGPINDLAQVFEHPQVVSRGLRFDLPHPSAGSVPSVGNPIRMSGTPVHYRSAPPTLGQHTAEVLAECGVGSEQLARLAESGVI